MIILTARALEQHLLKKSGGRPHGATLSVCLALAVLIAGKMTVAARPSQEAGWFSGSLTRKKIT
jgi:hypothetical protein